MMEWILRRLPWYSPEAQARRAARTEEAHHRAIRARINAERVLTDYQQADLFGIAASRPPEPPKKP